MLSTVYITIQNCPGSPTSDMKSIIFSCRAAGTLLSMAVASHHAAPLSACEHAQAGRPPLKTPSGFLSVPPSAGLLPTRGAAGSIPDQQEKENARKGALSFSVGLPGIEPGLHAPHACVLPVYYSPNYFVFICVTTDIVPVYPDTQAGSTTGICLCGTQTGLQSVILHNAKS